MFLSKFFSRKQNNEITFGSKNNSNSKTLTLYTYYYGGGDIGCLFNRVLNGTCNITLNGLQFNF